MNHIRREIVQRGERLAHEPILGRKRQQQTGGPRRGLGSELAPLHQHNLAALDRRKPPRDGAAEYAATDDDDLGFALQDGLLAGSVVLPVARPPSTRRVMPVTHSASSLQRKATAAAI